MKTTKGSPRETNRKTARLVGVLFIIGTVQAFQVWFSWGHASRTPLTL